VAGSATGIEGAQVAIAQGALAAVGVARYLGRLSPEAARTHLGQAAVGIQTARREALLAFHPEVERGREKVGALWAAYAATLAAG
jgi:sarcosine oxidase subunit alpha